MRTFIHRPSEIEWVGEGLRRAADLTVTAMTKDVPQDFEPYYPPDPLFGTLPHAHIMEADAAGEYWGRSVSAVHLHTRDVHRSLSNLACPGRRSAHVADSAVWRCSLL